MKTEKLKILLFGLTMIFMISCGEDEKETVVETPEISFKKEGELQLIKNGDVVKNLDIEIADSPYEWETGLMYREHLGENQGMLFIYPNEAPRSFYMKNTYIPLDIIFYSRDSTLIHIHENAVPRDESLIPSNGPAQFILEVNAGKAQEWNMETGDKIDFTRTGA